jgi:hypothetical protein
MKAMRRNFGPSKKEVESKKKEKRAAKVAKKRAPAVQYGQPLKEGK